MRKLAVLFVSLLFALPLMGYEQIWEGNSEGNIEINLQVDCYIQIKWQDDEIHFNDGTSKDPVTNTYDFWSTQLTGLAYAQCPDDEPYGGKHPMDPWAGGDYYSGLNGRYYESADGAYIYVHTNNQLSMTITTQGDLAGTINSANNTIPTWFTVCLAPFMIDDAWITYDDIPYDGDGSYLWDAGGNQFGVGSPGPKDPDQVAFACEPAGSWWKLGPMDPEIQGTIKILCRILRHGMSDPGDHYSTALTVAFSSP